MPPVSQRVPDLLGGVSQLAPHRRRPNELEESLNAYHSPARGFGKRPPTRHIAQLSAVAADYSGGKIIPLDYGTAQRFFAAIINGDLQVWDDSGTAQNVSFPHGKAYLNTPGALSFEQSDDFTDTNGTDVTAHATPFGASWVQISGVTNGAQIQSNVVEQLYPGSAKNQYVLSSEIPVNDYTVSYRVKVKGPSVGNGEVHLNIRGDGVTPAGYRARLVMTSTPNISIQRVDASDVGTNLNSGGPLTGLDALNWIKLSLRVTGSFLEVLINDVVMYSATDALNAYPTGRHVGFDVLSPSTFGRVSLIDDFKIEWEEQLPSDALGVIRTATTGRRTFIVNRNRKVLRDTSVKSTAQTPQALLYVEQADFATNYEVTLDGTSASYTTIAGSDAGSRRAISTEFITTGIKEALTTAFAGFTFTQYGSMIHIARTDGEDFTIATSDGLADNGLRAIKTSVQSAADLPLRCVEGFVVEVVGDPEEARDNYWVKFDTDGSDDFRGVWKECARPGEGIAFDATTMPHELVYSDKLTPEMEAKGFPANPVVSLSVPARDTDKWSNTLNGSDLSGLQLPLLHSHDQSLYSNLEDTNGGPIRWGFVYHIDTAKLDKSDSVTMTLEYNDGIASTTWTTAGSLQFGPGIFLKDQVFEVDINTPIGANWDVRVRLQYQNGATPSDFDNRAHLWVSYLPYYFNYSARDITWRSTLVYPKGTAWNITIDGGAPDVTYTQTTDMTGAAIAAALEPLIEAVAGISSVLGTDTRGGTYVRITKDAGGLPTVAVSSNYSADTTFWNPDLDIGYSDDALVGRTLRNLSDGSEGTITANSGPQITVAVMAGGVENIIRDGDRCVVVGSAEQFIFRQVAWEEREAGDSHTNPWPSFVDDYIRDVFFHRGRLGVLSAGNVVFSEAAVPDNFFRTVTTELLDSDPIDVSWSGGANTKFHSAVPWNGDIVCFGDKVQVVPRAEGVLGPKSVRLDLLSAYPCDDTLRPEPAGRWVFFGRFLGSQTRVQAMGISPRTRVAEAVNVSPDLTSYLAGDPLFMAGDSDLGLLFLVSDTDQRHLFHLRYTMGDDQPPAYSWGKWTFNGDILGMVANDGVLSLVVAYADGVYLENLDLSENY